jgi:putative colanic acid biosynthesis acetyltransferase WcaF
MNEPNSKVSLKDFNSSINYNGGKPKYIEALWYLIKMFFFLSAFPFPYKFKVLLLKLFGAEVGTGVVLKPRVNIHMPWNLKIGNDVWIGEEAFILNFEKVTIGSNVCISQRTFLCGGNHNYLLPDMPYRNAPITVKSGAWVGAGCFVAPGVTIGVDCVIAACSVVNTDTLANSIYKGNPAAYVKKRWA